MAYSQAWLESPTSIKGFLVEAKVYDVELGFDIDIFLSNIGYVSGDATITYMPSITGGLSFSESLQLDGGATLSAGDISIANYNGEIDSWLDTSKYIWNNREIKIYLGDPSWACNTLEDIHLAFELIFDGIIEDIDSKGRDTLDLRIRDKLERLNSPITENTLGTYGTWNGGQNTKDTIKPLVFGEVFNIPPLLVDPANLEYMVNDPYIHLRVTYIDTVIYCDSVYGISVNDKIVFGGTTSSGITVDTTYYIKTIDTILSTITISLSVGGAAVATTLNNDPDLVGRILSTNRATESIIEIRDNGVPIYTPGVSVGSILTTTATNSSLAITVDVAKTTVRNNAITCSSTKNFVVDAPIVFNGTLYGGIVAGTTYYIKNVYSPFEFTISSTLGGAVLTLTAGVAAIPSVSSATITLSNIVTSNSTTGLLAGKKIIFSTNVGGLTANTVYYVKYVYSTTQYSVSATIGGSAISLSNSGVVSVSTLVPSVLTYLDNGTFTLNNSVAGTLTASVQGVNNSISFPSNVATPVLNLGTYDNNIASTIALICTQYGKAESRLELTDIDQDNFYKFYTTYPQAIGTYISDKTNILDVCNTIANSVGAQLYITRKGKLQLLVVGVPTDDAVVDITDSDMIHHSLSMTGKLPVRPAIKLGYCKDWTIQTGLLTSIPEEHKTMYGTEWYSKTNVDSNLKNVYRINVLPEQKDTALIVGSDADAEALRLTDFFKVPRFTYSFTGTSKLLSLKLGQQVLLTSTRFNLAEGKLGQIIGLTPDWLTSTIQVEVLV